ncbi:mandelate racemase/muconate lactonizing enzyme family protein [Brevundimonas sp.]|uniref:mandelate racemase/muconate lactonizing enzyme family protein n=1 Tax=Brevundimonas sp. TaxID=1871086 RepID=UPI00286B182C|nr:mandelate racemase/muconate lactonizing enzyme family protein [Brevundimonas sp.]
MSLRKGIARLEPFLVRRARDTPYLGPLGPGDRVDPRGYIVRGANRTIYPVEDRSVVLRVTTHDGAVGWGETYGLIAPRVIAELIREVIAPGVIDRDPHDVEVLWEDLYDLMRVRGYIGGYYLDAIAALDIALWDLRGRMTGLPLHKLLGGARRDRVPAYASGLPRATLAERVSLARDLVAGGCRAIKFAGVVSHDGIEAEARALREALGPDVGLMVDLHWMFDRGQASALLQRLEPIGLIFAEAPCKTEDIEGWAWTARQTRTPIAGGEEWRTVHDAKPRLQAGAVSVVQPEMGHTGVTQFMRISRLAESFHTPVIPHATIGAGVFLSASLQASAALQGVEMHEYQHSIVDAVADLWTGAPQCVLGEFIVNQGPGLGLEPTDRLIAALEPL